MIIIAICWFGSGALGCYLGHRGAIRDYGTDIYAGGVVYPLTVLGGPVGLLGSIVAW